MEITQNNRGVTIPETSSQTTTGTDKSIGSKPEAKVLSGCLNALVRRHRRTKEDFELLRKRIIQVLEAGYDLPSICLILGERKDCVARCLMEEAMNRNIEHYPRNKSIIRCTGILSKIIGLDVGSFVEKMDLPGGGIGLFPVSITDIRRKIGIQE